MKKTSYILGIAALALVLAAPAISRADNENGSNQNENQSQNERNQPQSIRERLRADYQSRIENMHTNQGLRNDVLENRIGSSTGMMGSSTRMMGRENGDNENENGNDNGRNGDGQPWMGSTTMMRGEYENNGRSMHEEAFHARQDMIVNQLQRALDNLRNVRGRIETRIQKAQASGRDMSNAIALLTTADTKISAAQTAITALDTLEATSSTITTASSTATTTIVDLGKPRQIAAGAIQAIRDAQKALNAVVVAIAHSMGYRIDSDGAIETPKPTVTSTATSTP